MCRISPPAAENKLDSFSPVATESVKKEIVAAARDGCEVYFSRLFPATVRTQPWDGGGDIPVPCLTWPNPIPPHPTP